MARDRDPLRADGWAGSGGTGSDALAGGFSGSDSLAVTTAPDALRLPSTGDTLAVPTMGDVLSAGRSYGTDPFDLPALPVPPPRTGAAEQDAGVPTQPPAATQAAPPAGSTRAGRPGRPAGARAGAPGRPASTQAGGSGRPGGTRAARPATAAGAGAGQRRGGPTWADLQRMAPPSPQPPSPQPRGSQSAPRPPARPNRTTRPTGTVPWAGGSGWDSSFTGAGGTGRRGGGVPQSPVELGRALLDTFRRNLDGPR